MTAPLSDEELRRIRKRESERLQSSSEWDRDEGREHVRLVDELKALRGSAKAPKAKPPTGADLTDKQLHDLNMHGAKSQRYDELLGQLIAEHAARGERIAELERERDEARADAWEAGYAKGRLAENRTEHMRDRVNPYRSAAEKAKGRDGE